MWCSYKYPGKWWPVDIKFTKRKGGVDVNTERKGSVTALRIAAEEDHTNIVIEILKYQNAEGSIHDNEGFSPLLRATNEGHSGVFVSLLLLHGS